MTWAAYVVIVLEHLTVDAGRRGLEDFRNRMIRNSVVDLQRFIRAYRQGHTTTYQVADLEEREYGMIGNLPSGAIPEAFYTLSNVPDEDDVTHPNCQRNRMDFWPWVHRKTLLCTPCDARLYAYSISPYSKQFVIHPVLNDETELLLVWEGLKMDFDDGDTVPWPEEAAEASAAYVKWRILLEVDKNPALAREQFSIWSMKRLALYRDEQEKQDAEKPDEEYGASDAPVPPEMSAFGAQSVPFLSGITQLSGADGDYTALSAIPTTSLSVPYLVDVLIGGNVQRWVLSSSTAATAAGYQRPNDYDGTTNAKVWIQLS